MVKESNVLKKIYRVLDHVDADGTKWWNRLSFWNRAQDTECNDGQTVEEKIGSVKGVTMAENVTETGYLMDASIITRMINNLSSNANAALQSLNGVVSSLTNRIVKLEKNFPEENKLQIGNSAVVFSDNEGGNIRLSSPASVGGYWEIDGAGGAAGNRLRFFHTNETGTVDRLQSLPRFSLDSKNGILYIEMEYNEID